MNAVSLNYSRKDVKKKIKSFPREARKQILKTFNDLEHIKKKTSLFNILKGGYKEMAFTKKQKIEEEEEDDEEPIIEEEEDMEDLDSEDDDVKRGPGRRSNAEKAQQVKERFVPKTPAVYQRPEPVIKGRGWIVKSIPAIFQCIDSANGEIICDAGSYEELMLKLQVMATQHSVESAKNTR